MRKTHLLIAVFSALWCGCPWSSDPGPAGGGDLSFIYARGGDSVRLDPATVEDGESVLVISNVFESLVRYGKGTDLEPVLATAWKRADDGLSWTFSLREGVQFHNGERFDADAVALACEAEAWQNV